MGRNQVDQILYWSGQNCDFWPNQINGLGSNEGVSDPFMYRAYVQVDRGE